MRKDARNGRDSALGPLRLCGFLSNFRRSSLTVLSTDIANDNLADFIEITPNLC